MALTGAPPPLPPPADVILGDPGEAVASTESPPFCAIGAPSAPAPPPAPTVTGKVPGETPNVDSKVPPPPVDSLATEER